MKFDLHAARQMLELERNKVSEAHLEAAKANKEISNLNKAVIDLKFQNGQALTKLSEELASHSIQYKCLEAENKDLRSKLASLKSGMLILVILCYIEFEASQKQLTEAKEKNYTLNV